MQETELRTRVHKELAEELYKPVIKMGSLSFFNGGVKFNYL